MSPQKFLFCASPIISSPCHLLRPLFHRSDSEAALNCVVLNPGNSNWQPHTSLFTSRHQLSLLMKVSSPDVCNSRCWRFGGIRNRVSQLRRCNAAGTAADGCTPDTREDRGRLLRVTYHHGFVRRQKFVSEIAYKLHTGNGRLWIQGKRQQ